MKISPIASPLTFLNKELELVKQQLHFEEVKQKELDNKVKNVDKELLENNQDFDNKIDRLKVRKNEVIKYTEEIDKNISLLKKKIESLQIKDIELKKSLEKNQMEKENIFGKLEKTKPVNDQDTIINKSTQHTIQDEDKINPTIEKLRSLKEKLLIRNFELDQKTKILQDQFHLMRSQRNQLMCQEKDFDNMLKIIEEEERTVEERENQLMQKKVEWCQILQLIQKLKIKLKNLKNF